MRFSILSSVVVAAVLASVFDMGHALPVRLDRRDASYANDGPVTKVVKYVLNGVGIPTDTQAASKGPVGAGASERPGGYAAAPKAPASGGNYEREILCLVNKERRRVGLNPLSLHPAMTTAAEEHSRYQSRVQQMTHSDPQNGKVGSRLKSNGFNFSSASENVAEAPQASAKEVFDMWMNDPPHYQNIVDPGATYMGVACVDGFWTQDFGSSSDNSPQYSANSSYHDDYC